MKKIIILLSLLFVICVPKTSHLEDFSAPLQQLFPIREKVWKIKHELLPIVRELIEIGRKCGAHDYHSRHISIILSNIGHISTVCSYEHDWLLLLPYIEEKYRLEKYKYKKKTIQNTKELIQIELDSMQFYRSQMTNNAALHNIHKAIDIIMPILELLDEIDEILQQHINQEEQLDIYKRYKDKNK